MSNIKIILIKLRKEIMILLFNKNRKIKRNLIKRIERIIIKERK
jgi:hypothetical protein